jgi:DNA-directed RNA polymerase specialized sigma24 family protein
MQAARCSRRRAPIRAIVCDTPFWGTSRTTPQFTRMRKHESATDYHDLGEIIPDLRFIAGQYRSTPAAIDDLVELTLHTAVTELARRPVDLSISRWLQRIMKRIVLHLVSAPGTGLRDAPPAPSSVPEVA